MIEDYIQTIVNNGRIEDMEKLSDMLETTMEIVKNYDSDCYDKFEMELYKMAYGNTLNKEMAENIVHRMRPFGERFSYDEACKLKQERGLNDISEVDFYAVLNAMYNDYQNMFGEDTETYIRLALNFIEDEDAKSDKVFIYFTEIAE